MPAIAALPNETSRVLTSRQSWRGDNRHRRNARCADRQCCGAIWPADQDRFQHGDDRRPRRQRKVRAARPEDLGGGRQRQGRALRPSRQARLLRRPEQSLDGAGHLHQAARRRQGRPHHRAYATAQIAPAMPIVMSKNKVFIGLLGLAVNSEFKYPNYFAMLPAGPDPKPAVTKGFFDTAMAQSPKPQTVAIVAADQEFSRNCADGASENAQKEG